MTINYWDRFTTNRLSRRRALQAGASVGLGAAALALLACSDDDDSGGSKAPVSKDKSGFLITPTQQLMSGAKRGGHLNVADPILGTFEQNQNTSGSGGILVPNVYSQLMRIKVGTYDNPPNGETEPEFAESYEVAPDGLTITFKLRGLKYDDRAPTNGRASDSSDAKYGWDRWTANNVRRQDLDNKVTPDAPVTSVTTPDAKTLVFKLAFPFAPFMTYMSSGFFPFMYPKEAESFNTKGIARGTGPWRADDDVPNGDGVFRRNPNYYEKDQPWHDNLTIHKISEYSTIFAQFKTGALDMHLLLLQEDVLSLKKSTPKLVMYQKPYFAKGCGGIFFGRKPGSPFNDERVRKALSMNLDRELWAETFSNRKKFESEGLPVDTRWFSGAGPGYSWYLNPQKGEMGDAGKNLQYNVAEAKKMLQAAGVKTPLQSVWHTPPMGNGGAVPANNSMIGQFQESGDFQFSTDVLQPTDYFDKVRNTGGNFDGIGIAFYFDHHDFDWTMFLKYHPSSTDFWMKTGGEDKKITDFVNRQRRELDPKKREQIFQDFTKYDVQQMNYIPHFPADYLPYYIGQPWLGGWGWHQPYIEQYIHGAGQLYTNYWSDSTKKS